MLVSERECANFKELFQFVGCVLYFSCCDRIGPDPVPDASEDPKPQIYSGHPEVGCQGEPWRLTTNHSEYLLKS